MKTEQIEVPLRQFNPEDKESIVHSSIVQLTYMLMTWQETVEASGHEFTEQDAELITRAVLGSWVYTQRT